MLATMSIALVGANNTMTVNVNAALDLPKASDTCKGACPLIADPSAVGGEGSDLKKVISDFILGAARILTFVAVAVSILYMIWGGYTWMDVNNPDGAKKGQQIVTNSAIGLAIAILAYTIVGLLTGFLTGNIGEAFGVGGTPAAGTPAAEAPVTP